MTRRLSILVWLLLALVVRAAPLDLERDLGCKPWDYSAGVDNADKIQTLYLDQLGKTVFDPLYIPGKWYAIAKTLRFPDRCGGRITTGGGRTIELSDDNRNDWFGSAAELIWTGPRDGTVIDLPGVGWVIDDLTLMGAPRHHGGDLNLPQPRCAFGVRIHDGMTPVGKSTLSLTLIGFDVGVEVSGASGWSHGDTIQWPWFAALKCGTGFRLGHVNAVGHQFGLVWCEGTDVLFDCIGSCDLVTDRIQIDTRTTLLRTANISPNARRADLRGIRVDNHADGTVLFESLDRSSAMVSLSGYANNQATVNVKDNGTQPNLRLDFGDTIPKELAKRYPR